MSKDKLNKAVGNSFEDLKDEEMEKTQGAGDTDAETWTVLANITIQTIVSLFQK
ncbi:type 2 lantibiotic [Butyrivibrio sp. XB500-5]|uniref:mersacidin family lantibiotic n=1 Tax=Butyrivibrio sp. XB500-5 TaxID=2364880 RepID=UPI000EAAAB46|nr:lichenicidin A2 family type 2 lantibiotic [Butyrivibrio sp. XB500-5]RKM59699.1 type 2 lantibiotic [Butyrivibrio sp. XB500-5]